MRHHKIVRLGHNIWLCSKSGVQVQVREVRQDLDCLTWRGNQWLAYEISCDKPSCGSDALVIYCSVLLDLHFCPYRCRSCHLCWPVFVCITWNQWSWWWFFWSCFLLRKFFKSCARPTNTEPSIPSEDQAELAPDLGLPSPTRELIVLSSHDEEDNAHHWQPQDIATRRPPILLCYFTTSIKF